VVIFALALIWIKFDVEKINWIKLPSEA